MTVLPTTSLLFVCATMAVYGVCGFRNFGDSA